MKTKSYTRVILTMMEVYLAIIVLISCSDEGATKGVEVIVNQSTLEFEAEGGVQSFKLQANTDLWLSYSIRNSAEWCTLSQTNGSLFEGSWDITVDVPPNMDGKVRETVLEIASPRDGTYFPPIYVTVKQGFQYATCLSVSSTDIAIPTNETHVYLSVEADAYWEVKDVPDWIEIYFKQGFGDERLSIRRLTEENRTGKFLIVSQEKQIEINIETWGKEKAYIDLYRAGDLADELYWADLYNVARTLKISGKMNAADFRVVKNLLVLEEIDLSNIEFSNKVNTIPSYSLSECSFRSIILPKNLLSIDSGALSLCPELQTIDIPEGVVSIEDFAFQYCISLRSVTLPSTLQRMNIGVFSGCSNLNEIHIKNPVPFDIPSIVGYPITESCTLYVPEGTKEKYQQTAGWAAFKNIVEEL